MHGTRYLYGASGIANLALAAEELRVGDSLVQQWMCEVCEKTGASYGVEMGAKRRWCAPCGKKKGGVRVVS